MLPPLVNYDLFGSFHNFILIVQFVLYDTYNFFVYDIVLIEGHFIMPLDTFKLLTDDVEIANCAFAFLANNFSLLK